MRQLARAAAIVLAGLLAVGVASYVAGEQVEVAVLRTRDAAGRVQEAKLWVAETRRAVDAAFAAKYGVVDAWYGLLLRRNAVPVRLVPRGE